MKGDNYFVVTGYNNAHKSCRPVNEKKSLNSTKLKKTYFEFIIAFKPFFWEVLRVDDALVFPISSAIITRVQLHAKKYEKRTNRTERLFQVVTTGFPLVTNEKKISYL